MNWRFSSPSTRQHSIGDRLVGYTLLLKTVDQAVVRGIPAHLQAAGIEPEEAITDDSRLYVAVLAEIRPVAAHRVRLFMPPDALSPQSTTWSHGCVGPSRCRHQLFRGVRATAETYSRFGRPRTGKRSKPYNG